MTAVWSRRRERRSLGLAFALLLGMLSGAPSDAADLDCLIEPHVVVQVTPSVDGLLEQVAVDRGDLVERGQLVATLESSQEKATVLLAAARARIESPLKSSQARLEFGERRLARTLDLFQKELIPLREMDEAETAKVLAEIAVLEAGENRRIAELELERATAALQLRSVASPVTGVVMERFLSAGEYVKQTPILKIAQIDPLRVEVIAPVALLGRLAPGMEAVVMPEAPAGGTYRARVKVVDRVVDAASGTFGIRLELPNPGYKLAGGLKCKVRFPSVRK